MDIFASVFIYVFNYFTIRVGVLYHKKKHKKKKDNKLKMTNLILGVDIFFQNKKIYKVFHILNLLAFIMEIFCCFLKGISNKSIWDSLLGNLFLFSGHGYFVIVFTNYFLMNKK